MKIALLCLLFIPIIYLAVQQKKWYLCLFFAFWTVLPEQMAFEIHEKLPNISAGRLLVLLLFGFWLWDRWKAKRLQLPKSLLIFLGVNIIVSLVNFRFGFGEVNRMFILFFERVLPVIMIADMVKDREELDIYVDFLILGGSALAIIGIIQTVFKYDITTPLHWMETLSSITLSERMGLTRAFGTYNAISFGCYTALVSIVVIYRLYNAKALVRKLLYSLALALVMSAMICSLSRSAWLSLVAALFLVVLFTKGRVIPRSLIAMGMSLVLILTLMVFQPNLKNAFVETTKSTVNTILDVLPEGVSSTVVRVFTPSKNSNTTAATGDDETLQEEDPPATRFELDDEFGLNGEDPGYSRNAQWTAVKHMAMENNLLFGLGYNALPEGRIYFYFDRWGAVWEPTTFLDVGLVALIAEGGLVGAVSYLLLLGYILVCAFWKRDRKTPMDMYHMILYIIPLLLMLNYLAAFIFEDLVWLLTAMFYAYHRISGNEKRDALQLPKLKAN